MKFSKTNMSCPWVESPFFHAILKDKELTDDQKLLASKFNMQGYLVLDLELSDEFINELKTDILNKLNVGQAKNQEGGYHYSDSPRVFEAWKFSKAVRQLALNQKVIDTLKMLYGKQPFPFQTINFLRGSNQPFHSDTLHFHTEPERWVVGVWTALEDMTEENGTLQFCPYSHRMPVYGLHHLNLKPSEYGKQFDNYSIYEEFIAELIVSQKLTKSKFFGKKGQALIWAANMLHGGSEVKDSNSTRWSQATHYYFEGCNHYYSPLFSDIPSGKYADKDLTGKNFDAVE